MNKRLRRALICCWLAGLAVAGLGGCGAGTASAGGTPSAGGGSHTVSRAALVAILRGDLTRYLADRGRAEHMSAVGLTATFRGSEPAISLAAGTTRYGGGGPVSPDALWQIGSNTKAFTAVMLLQLEAEGKLSITDTLGQWLPQYPAWRDITIKQLLNMTSGIPDPGNDDDLPGYQAFLSAIASGADLSAAKVVSYAGAAVTGDTWLYSNTNYVLAQLIIEKVTQDTYGDQLARRIAIPLGLRSLCFAPSTCPAVDATRMPSGYFFDTAVAGHEPPNPLASLIGRAVPPLNLTEYQGAAAIVSSLQGMTAWDRALYQGQLLPPTQQRQLESLVSITTGQPIAGTTQATPLGYGLGVIEQTVAPFGTVWAYEGDTIGYRVLHLYFPRSGLIVALAANSSPAPGRDDLFTLAGSVYQALQKARLG
ncbi:MAG: serine hydrolase domain-containing protein [Streptosporangiaceae bacterium]